MILTITGGTGSLGKALLSIHESLYQMGIRRIRILSRDEQKQVFLQRTYNGCIPLDCFLADVTDYDRMLFGLKDSDYVIHAAAQKHIEKFETDVKTGYKTNIIGTQNVAQAFLHSKNAKGAVLASTDKAALPITTYGISKLAAERVWLWHNTFQKDIAFRVARYGNILGSRGSVIETWTRQAKEKQKLTVTDTECTRFFMTLNSAARFVLGCLIPGSPQELNIPRMKGTEMLRLAKIIWNHWNPNEAFAYEELGMRSIEKVHEILEEEGLNSSEVEQFTDEELEEMYREWLGQNSSS